MKAEAIKFNRRFYKAILISNYRPYNELHIEWEK